MNNLTILTLLFLLIYLWFHRIPMLYRPKIKARITSFYLNNLPKSGVLVEGLIAYPIAYRSHKRIVVLPHDPSYEDAKNRIELSIKKFDLHYAIISDLWQTEAHLGYPAIDIVKGFKLIKTIREDGDVYYIFELA